MISAIIQARVGSTRLHNKIFADLEGKPLIWHVVDRLKKSKYLNSIIIATPTNSNDDVIENWANDNNILCYRGNETNVLNRYYETAKHFNTKIIVRITADDPFKDYNVMDQVIELFIKEGADFASNNNPPSFPEGLDVEVISIRALRNANNNAKTNVEKEHVTPFFYNNPKLFKIVNLSNDINLSHLRWTIDEEKDLEMVRRVYKELYIPKKQFLFKEALNFILKNPEIPQINNGVKRSIMFNK